MAASGSTGALGGGQRIAQRRRIGVALRWIGGHRASDDRREGRRELVQVGRGGPARRQGAGRVNGGDRRTTGQHLVQHGAKRPHIAPCRGGLTREPLRGGVAERADHLGRSGQGIRRAVERRNPEVDEVERPVIVDQDVRRLDVAVDDSLVMGGRQRVGDDRRDRDSLAGRQRPFGNALVEWPAGDEVHDQGGFLGVVDEVARADDRRVVDRAERRRLSFEPGSCGRVGDDMRVQALERHDLPRAFVARTPDRGHPADGVAVEQPIALGDQMIVHPESAPRTATHVVAQAVVGPLQGRHRNATDDAGSGRMSA